MPWSIRCVDDGKLSIFEVVISGIFPQDDVPAFYDNLYDLLDSRSGDLYGLLDISKRERMRAVLLLDRRIMKITEYAPRIKRIAMVSNSDLAVKIMRSISQKLIAQDRLYVAESYDEALACLRSPVEHRPIRLPEGGRISLGS